MIKKVVISREQHLLVYGQVGTIRLKVSAAMKAARDLADPELLAFVSAIDEELGYLEKYFPLDTSELPF